MQKTQFVDILRVVPSISIRQNKCCMHTRYSIVWNNAHFTYSVSYWGGGRFFRRQCSIFVGANCKRAVKFDHQPTLNPLTDRHQIWNTWLRCRHLPI